MTRPPGAPKPEPHLRPTKASTLVLTALLAAVVGWWLVSNFYGNVDQLPWLALATMLLLAIVEGVAAFAVKGRIERRPGTEPVDPLFAARLVALAKASSLGGSMVGGLYAGVFAWVFWQRNQLAAASEDVPVAAGGVLCAALLVGAALWLEYACRIPEGPDDTEAEGDPAPGL
jgi:hypothetical protein